MEFGTLGRQECTATNFNNLKRESSAGRRRICQYLNSHETRYMRSYARDRMTDIGRYTAKRVLLVHRENGVSRRDGEEDEFLYISQEKWRIFARRCFRGCPEISDLLLHQRLGPEAEVGLFSDGKPHFFPMTSAP